MPATLAYAVTSDWTSGFVGELALRGGETGLNGWTVAFDAGFAITNIWGAEIVSHTGTHYVLRSLSWNSTVAAGGSINIGFLADTLGSGSALAGLALNNQAQAQPPVVALPPPAATVADVTLAEGDAGTRELVFTVTLDKPATGAVVLDYATADGTARAGQDYQSLAGTLRFEAGETSKTVRVAISGDTVVEADETLLLRLFNPSGATLARAEATGTLHNDDISPPPPPPPPVASPVVGIAGAAVAEGTPGAAGTAVGFFSTAGNQIIDAAGQAVKIAGVSWFGFEGETQAPHGLWTRNWHEMMQEIAASGFNTIRLPFSSEMLHTAAPTDGIDFNLNPDLVGLTGLQIMDKVVGYAGQLGLRVILDHHSNRIGVGVGEDGLWYRPGEAYTEDRWVQDWQALATRYAGNATVIGADLHNEPWAATWGGGGANDWHRAAERAGNAVLAANPDWLVFVEGVAENGSTGYWWGGNLTGVRDNPVVLDVPNKLVYSAHDYPNSVYAQSWFQQPGFGDQLAAKFDQMWGYIYRENIAPVYLGEFGSRLEDPKDQVWLDKLLAYLSGDLDANGTVDIAPGQQGISWTWWSWNPNSSDTGGILADDWRTVLQDKLDRLEPLQFALGAAPQPAGDAHNLLFTVTLSAPAAEAVLVDYATLAGSADAADFTPATGTLRFEAGETSKTIAVAITADALTEANETLSVVLSNARGATLGPAAATGTILNDDTALAAPPFPAEAGLEGQFAITDNWVSGFVGQVEVDNHGPAAVNGWTLQLTMPYQITEIWDAEIVSHQGDVYVIRNAAWNGGLVDEGSTTFGFVANGGANATLVDLVF
jgi:aryl-phospho-beta-D-glucosidase BglC (GH1 family)